MCRAMLRLAKTVRALWKEDSSGRLGNSGELVWVTVCTLDRGVQESCLGRPVLVPSRVLQAGERSCQPRAE